MDLQRFLDAQDAPAAGVTVYEQALAELTAGAKRTHWMWFVFPQLAGLGHSAMAQRYAIADLAEARAYLDHQVLGQRLRACVAAVNEVAGRSGQYWDNRKTKPSSPASHNREHAQRLWKISESMCGIDNYFGEKRQKQHSA